MKLLIGLLLTASLFADCRVRGKVTDVTGSRTFKLLVYSEDNCESVKSGQIIHVKVDRDHEVDPVYKNKVLLEQLPNKDRSYFRARIIKLENE